MFLSDWWQRLNPRQRGQVVRLAALAALGVALMAWGSGLGQPAPRPAQAPAPAAPSSGEWGAAEAAVAQELTGVLEAIPGVGPVTVAVDLQHTPERQYLSTRDSAQGAPLVLEQTNGQAVVPLGEVGPSVVGVVVVAPAAADPRIREELTEAVETLLGVAPYQVLVLPDQSGAGG
ncbi:MAG: hypothetical protein K6U14_03430 [Firmicutes bacterium]|nr:hypothetical protein [Alicyclobacillaceae bacterium]MCL6496671.1 hypothetical protein [Bacillota bacterium]